MSKSPRNATYKHTEVVKVTIEVEIGYDAPDARADALTAATQLAESSVEIGGAAGKNGRYNAIRLFRAAVSYDDPTNPKGTA